MKNTFRKFPPKMKAAPASSKRAAQSTPDYLKAIVSTVKKLWEEPANPLAIACGSMLALAPPTKPALLPYSLPNSLIALI